MFKSFIKGKFAEAMSNITLELALDKNIYTLHKNVTLEIEEDTTQIDHIIISKYGIFVIETKNYGGWIYGGEHQKQWTQKLYKKSFKFQNPLHQNYKHIKFLQSILSIPNVMELEERDFISLIHFTGERAELKTELPNNVMTSGVLPFIKEHEEIKLSDIKIKILNERLETKKLKACIKTDILHVKNLKEKHKKEEENTKKLTTSKLALLHNIKTDELNKKLVEIGYLEEKETKLYLTNKGKEIGGEWKPNKFGGYFLWNEDTKI